MTQRLRQTLPDALWLALLAVYLFIGTPLLPFHGDEGQHLYLTHEYAQVFAPGYVERTPPIPQLETAERVGLINGTTTRYTVGWMWHVPLRVPAAEVPPPVGWHWGEDFATNAANGYISSPNMLLAGRATATLFLWGSVVALFALGRLLGGRPAAYIATLLYALHPSVLLHARRASVEGHLLFGGLMLMALAAWMARRWWRGGRVPPVAWGLLALAGGFTVASKHNGVVFVAAAFGWLGLTALLMAVRARAWRAFGWRVLTLTVSGVCAIGVFFALTPRLWTDPLPRLQYILQDRRDALTIRLEGPPASTAERVLLLLTEPYMRPPQFYEHFTFRDAPLIQAQIARYSASPWGGIPYGFIGGGVLTVLALFGAVLLLRRRDWPFSSGMWVWLALMAALVLVNPLNWQRYALPLVPVTCLLAALGVAQPLAQLLKNRDTQAVVAAAPVGHT